MPKNPHAVALGKIGGAVGGKSRSEAKQKAARANGAKNKGKPKSANEAIAFYAKGAK